MNSSVSWLDFDHAAREKAQQMLALFREPGTRDELGLGSIRDALAYQMFPGVSTIQTRLRYMLLVPWVYQRLEERKEPASSFEDAARNLEFKLIQELLTAGEASEHAAGGIIGARSGDSLQRLPSSVYWTGLGIWGIRRFAGSQDEYHRSIDWIYAERKRRAAANATALPDWDTTQAETWHPKLPKPESFPNGQSIELSVEEAQFLKDRILESQPNTYLAWLAQRNKPDDSAFPWQYTTFDELPESISEIVNEARQFSGLMHGASLLYNLLLARRKDVKNLVDAYSDELDQWAQRMNWSEVRRWNLDVFFSVARRSSHQISCKTKTFVKSWHLRACTTKGSVAEDEPICELVRSRERHKKKAHSRFDNPTMLQNWSGASGAQRMDFRWPTVRQFIADLHRD